MSEFLQVEKDCGTSTSGCFDTINYFDGSTYLNAATTTRFYKVILSDGTALIFNYNNGNQNILFDIDGTKKGKNSIGHDIFQVDFRNNGNTLEV